MTISTPSSAPRTNGGSPQGAAQAEPSAGQGEAACPVDADLPLAGVRVLDLTRYLSGPYATLLLAEMGAQVIKIEVPEAGDDTRHIAPLQGDVSFYHSTVNRSKASVDVDLKSEEGRKLILAMVADCDVFIQNFRTGVAERLGFGYDVISAINPRAVYCSISGFGATGPDSRRAAFDLIVQAESGVMSLNGDADRPPSKLGLPVADLTSGMFAVHGVLAALLKRTRTGKGEPGRGQHDELAAVAVGLQRHPLFRDRRISQAHGLAPSSNTPAMSARSAACASPSSSTVHGAPRIRRPHWGSTTRCWSATASLDRSGQRA